MITEDGTVDPEDLRVIFKRGLLQYQEGAITDDELFNFLIHRFIEAGVMLPLTNEEQEALEKEAKQQVLPDINAAETKAEENRE
jgi:hypothetical protein